MRLQQIDLENVCQYSSFSLKLGPGVVGILGPNGAGKSNLIKMAQACWTNDFSVNPGVKADNVRYGIGEAVRSRVRTIWEHNGTEFSLVRGLQSPINNRLELPGKKPITNAREIEAALREIVGVSRKVISDYIFVDQWQIFSFISAKAADRATSFMSLCDTAKAEQLWTLLGDESKRTRRSAVLFVDNSEMLKTQAKDLHASLEKNKQLCLEHRRNVLSQERLDQLQSIVSASRKRQLLQSQLTAALANISDDKKQVELLEKQLIAGRAVLDAAEKLVVTTRCAADIAEREVDIWDDFRNVEHNRRTLSLAAAKKAPICPEEPDGYRHSSKCMALLSLLRSKLNNAVSVLRVFEQEGTVQCPTCGTSKQSLQDHLLQLKADESSLPGKITLLQAKLEQSKSYEQRLSEYETELLVWKQGTEKAKEQLEALKSIDPPEREKSELLEVIYAYQDALEELQEARIPVAKAEANLVSAELRYKSSSASIDSIKQELALLPHEAVGVDEAQEILARHKVAVDMSRLLDSQTKETARMLKQVMRDYKACQQLAAKSKVAIDWLDDIDRWRSVVHRDALPKMASQKMLEDIVDSVNRSLDEFENPFYVSADEDLSFVVHKPDGTQCSAERLSGGQKVLLAIAFRFAVCDTFANDLGMFVLDEPTAGVDYDNMSRLVDVMDKAASFIRKRGQQLIVITHDQRLERIFDQVVNIEASK